MCRIVERVLVLCCLLTVLLTASDVFAQTAYYMDVCDKDAVVGQLNSFEVKVRDSSGNAVNAAIDCWTNAPGAGFNRYTGVFSWKPMLFTKGTFQASFSAEVMNNKVSKTINISTLSIEKKVIRRNVRGVWQIDLHNDRLAWVEDQKYIFGSDMPYYSILEYFRDPVGMGYDSIDFVKSGDCVAWGLWNTANGFHGIYYRTDPISPIVPVVEHTNCELFDVYKNRLIYKAKNQTSDECFLYAADIINGQLQNKQILDRNAYCVSDCSISGDKLVHLGQGQVVYVRDIAAGTKQQVGTDGYRPDIYRNSVVWTEQNATNLWYRDISVAGTQNKKLSANAFAATIYGDKIAYTGIEGNRIGVLTMHDLGTGQNIRVASQLNGVTIGYPIEKNKIAYFSYGDRGVDLNMAVIHIAPAIRSLSASLTAPGREITITGRNFGFDRVPGQNVYFANVNRGAVINSWTDDTIKCVVPDGALSGDVKVQTPDGESNGFYVKVQKKPSAPKNLRLQTSRRISVAGITLVWKDTANNEQGFKVYRSIVGGNGSMSLPKVYEVPKNAGVNSDVSWPDPDCSTRGTVYHYRVSAYNEDGETTCELPPYIIVRQGK